MLLADAGKGKALAWAGVPPEMTGQFSAGDWIKPVLQVSTGWWRPIDRSAVQLWFLHCGWRRLVVFRML
jgi:hypothetical protein